MVQELRGRPKVPKSLSEKVFLSRHNIYDNFPNSLAFLNTIHVSRIPLQHLTSPYQHLPHQISCEKVDISWADICRLARENQLPFHVPPSLTSRPPNELQYHYEELQVRESHHPVSHIPSSRRLIEHCHTTDIRLKSTSVSTSLFISTAPPRQRGRLLRSRLELLEDKHLNFDCTAKRESNVFIDTMDFSNLTYYSQQQLSQAHGKLAMLCYCLPCFT